MPTPVTAHEDLNEVLELNRLFLRYLKQHLETHGTVLDLPSRVAPVLRRTSVDALDQASEFPRALFALRLAQWLPWQLMDPSPTLGEMSYFALQLTMLHRAWTISRRSGYAARLFLGLSESEVKRLRATPLGELHAAALGNAFVACAFPQAEWLWLGLLTENAPERRRQLRLLALQPNLDTSAAGPLELTSSTR